MLSTLQLDPSSKEPPYMQIASAIRRAIEEGELRLGQPLPSCQQLAESIAVSRLTVRRGYELLGSQGYIKAFHRGKTFVSKTPPKTSLKAVPTYDERVVTLSAYGERLLALPERSTELNSESYCGAPRLDELPIGRWRECLNLATRSVGSELLSYENDPFGYLPLREAICQFIARARSMVCSADQIVVFTSTEGGADLLFRILLNHADPVCTEDPGFVGIWASFKANGFEVATAPVDNDGLIVEELDKLQRKPRLVYVSPSHQDPTGVTLSHERKLQLLSWAKANAAWVIEDDFGSEFRYGKPKPPSLQSMDRDGTVIYRYNFWKSLYPLVRIGFTVIPKSLEPVVRRAQNLLHRDVPLVEQAALATMIRKGYFEKHLQICNKLYARRRASLFLALSRHFAKEVTISPDNGGTQLRVRFASHFDEKSIELAAAQASISLLSTKDNYFNVPRPANEFLLNFVGINDALIESRVAKFKELCLSRGES